MIGLSPSISFNKASSNYLDPSYIRTLHRWYEADFGITTIGDDISVVADRSGNGGNATQGVGANRPELIADGGADFNNRPVMRFNGTTDFLNIADFDYVDYNNLNIFAVVKSTDLSASANIVTHANVLDELAWSLFTTSSAKISMTIAEDGSVLDKTTDNSTVLVVTKSYLFSTKFDTTDLKMSLNGIDESVIVNNDPMTQFFDSPALLLMGAIGVFGAPSQFFKGDIPAVVIAGKMTANEINGLNHYLIDKWLNV